MIFYVINRTILISNNCYGFACIEDDTNMVKIMMKIVKKLSKKNFLVR